MPLAAGRNLTHYEILDPLGAGGMGEVYRARDTRLEREVAIKVLPEELAGDEERLARFEREAKTLAALNHPSVAQVFGIDQEGDLRFIVMELVPGQDLAQHLERGTLPVREAVRLCLRIAEGLAATHAAGVVHRDLKPANVRMLPDGRLKLIDFGLAKRHELTGDADTVEAKLTQSGMIMGTVAYMSPEQARGAPADHRSDQFALGVILHEAITGRTPFARKTLPETLAAILHGDPPSLRELAPEVPVQVAWIAERCLSPEPEGRYDSTGDLVKELEFVSERLPELSAPALERGEDAAGKPWRTFVLAGAGLLILATAAALSGVFDAGDRAGESLASYERVTFRRGAVSSARFDPASDDVLYSAAWDGGEKQVHLVRSGSSDAITVGPPGSELLSISPAGELLIQTDARFAGPFQEVGRLSRMQVTGAPRELATDVRTAVFGPDEEVAALVRVTGNESVLEFPQGTPRLTTGGMLLNLSLSPDGRRLALAHSPQLGHEWGSVVVLDRDGGETPVECEAGRGLVWSPDGEELWYVSKSDQTSLEARDLAGRVRTLATFPSVIYLFDVDPDGRVLLATEERRYEMTTWRLAANGSAADSEQGGDRDLTWLSWSVPFDISDDGERILFNEWTGGKSRVALRGLGHEPPVLLGRGDWGVALSTDGEWVLSTQPWNPRELAILSTRTDDRRTIPLRGFVRVDLARFLPESDAVLFSGSVPDEGGRIFRVEVDGGAPVALTPDGIEFGFFAVSSDGSEIAASRVEGGFTLYPVDGGEPRHFELDEQPIRWSEDADALFTATLSEVPGRVHRVDLSTGAAELVATLMPADEAGVERIGPTVIAPDGRTIVYGYERRLSTLFVVDGLH